MFGRFKEASQSYSPLLLESPTEFELNNMEQGKLPPCCEVSRHELELQEIISLLNRVQFRNHPAFLFAPTTFPLIGLLSLSVTIYLLITNWNFFRPHPFMIYNERYNRHPLPYIPLNGTTATVCADLIFLSQNQKCSFRNLNYKFSGYVYDTCASQYSSRDNLYKYKICKDWVYDCLNSALDVCRSVKKLNWTVSPLIILAMVGCAVACVALLIYGIRCFNRRPKVLTDLKPDIQHQIIKTALNAKIDLSKLVTIKEILFAFQTALNTRANARSYEMFKLCLDDKNSYPCLLKHGIFARTANGDSMKIGGEGKDLISSIEFYAKS